mmetsp:Transcript_18838/g.24459  ORF Transcript_18838/g.24459 Transcript_18838/m.24459 type:complete len:82 (-) Transcript_18838:41-286(-)
MKLVLYFSMIAGVVAMQAPDKADYPPGFCPSETGTPTATTGECMCNWQDRRGCEGSKCMYQYGLAWYHYSCADCKCIAEPK